MAATRMAPVIVLSTGRCGSTMLSDMLNCHPKILSLSEFFTSFGVHGFFRKRLDGKAIWEMCRRPPPSFRAMLASGEIHDRIVYPLDTPQARFSPHNIPTIMCTTLPHLTPDFESLYDELETVVPARPEADLADQYRFLFEWLCDRFDRSLWVERSGGSLVFGFRLIQLFPEARIVHIYRDGRDTALSMSRHQSFRAALAATHKLQRMGMKLAWTVKNPLGLPPTLSASRRFLISLFDRFTSIEKMMHQEFPLEAYGEMWNQMIQGGQACFSSLPPERFFALCYEDVLQQPREKLRELIEFIDPSLADDAWLDATAQIARPNPPKYPSLDAETQLRLTRACAPGLEALGYPM